MWIALPEVVSVQSDRKRLTTTLVVMRPVVIDPTAPPTGIHQLLVRDGSYLGALETTRNPKLTRLLTITVSTGRSVSKRDGINVDYGTLLLLHFKTIVFRKLDSDSWGSFLRLVIKWCILSSVEVYFISLIRKQSYKRLFSWLFALCSKSSYHQSQCICKYNSISANHTNCILVVS